MEVKRTGELCYILQLPKKRVVVSFEFIENVTDDVEESVVMEAAIALTRQQIKQIRIAAWNSGFNAGLAEDFQPKRTLSGNAPLYADNEAKGDL
jgi:hypothetical protein